MVPGTQRTEAILPHRTGNAAFWGAALAGIIVVVICVFAYRANRALIDAGWWTNHTFQVIAELRTAEASLRGASAEMRAFAINGDEIYATAMEKELTSATEHLKTLHTMIDDNPAQVQRVHDVMGLVERRAAAMREAARIYRESGGQKGEEYFAGGDPTHEMDRICERLDEIAVVEQQLLHPREASATRAARISSILLVAGGIAVFGVLISAVALVWREGTHRLKLEADLREAAENAQKAALNLSEMNHQLEAANDGLQSANRELEAFSYTVSHDLRAPLRSVDGFSRILLQDHATELSAEAAGYLKRVRGGAQQMGLLIDDLLAFSRLGRQPIKTQHVDLGMIANQIVAQLKEDRPDQQIEVIIDPLPPAKGDAALIRQAMSNLISNAFKFSRTRESPRVQVGYRSDSGEPAYFVRDNGVGFDMRYADKLFGVFQRLHRADEFEGTGVGLAIVQRIVQRHGGRAWAEGRLNEGAVFWFSLPGVQNT